MPTLSGERATVRHLFPQILFNILRDILYHNLPPRAPVLPRPCQHPQVPIPSCDCAPRLIPRAVVRPRPLQPLQYSDQGDLSEVGCS
jgi:hypothetical protein